MGMIVAGIVIAIELTNAPAMFSWLLPACSAVGVVVEREAPGSAKIVHQPVDVDQLGRTERRDEQAEGRDRPHDRDDERRDRWPTATTVASSCVRAVSMLALASLEAACGLRRRRRSAADVAVISGSPSACLSWIGVVDDDRHHQDEQDDGERRDRPASKLRNWVYISFARTEVLLAPAVIVRTMSKTFSEAIEIVVSTTMSAGRMPGIDDVAEPLPGVRPVELGGLELLRRARP